MVVGYEISFPWLVCKNILSQTKNTEMFFAGCVSFQNTEKFKLCKLGLLCDYIMILSCC